LHHVVLERWSRRSSLLHARDPRAKILAAFAFLVALATTRMTSPWPAVSYGGFLLGAALLSKLPLGSLMLRAAAVLPFSGTFATMSLLAGNAPRAAELLEKSYLSALAVLLVVATTPMPEFLRALESLGAPRFLLMVVQFLYRYLFVISEQAQHMRLAASCRGSLASLPRHRRRWLRAAGGALATLFARSYGRAEGVHRAMISRGFRGHFVPLSVRSFGWADTVFLLLGVLAPICLRVILAGAAK
jgi:cobalt/nickel transport system permease protein